MALQVWLPLNRDLHNQGLAGNLQPSGSGYTVNANGKIGSCMSVTSTINLGYNGSQINTGSISFGGWFKFNKNAISTALASKTFTETANSATGNLVGNNSYGGISLQWVSNNMYNTSGVFNSISVCSYWRSSTNGARSTSYYTIPFDTWIHIFLIFDKNINKCSLYINGNLYASSTGVAFSDAPSRAMQINYEAVAGGNGPGSNIPFDCNDIRIYDHCLSDKEIAEIAKALVLHYPLNNNGLGQPNLLKGGYQVTTTSSSETAIGTLELDTIRMPLTSLPGKTFTFTYDYSVEGNKLYSTGDWRKDRYGIHLSYNYTKNGTTSNTYPGTNYLEVSGTGRAVQTFSIPADIIVNSFSFGIQPYNKPASGNNAIWYLKNVKLEEGLVDNGYTPYSDNYTIIYDSSGYGNNGTIAGTLTVSENTSKYKHSTIFDGSTAAIQTPNLKTIITDKTYTISCWTYKTQIGSKNYQTIYGGPSGFELEARSSSTTNPLFRIHNWGGGTTPYEFGQWYHFCFVHTDDNSKLYINGELKITGTSANIPSGNYFIGAWNTSSQQNYDGNISDFRIYATALSADDVLELYKTSKIVNGTTVTIRDLE